MKKLAFATFMLIGIIGLVGCSKEEAPAEQAGEAVEEAADELGDAVEDAGDRVKDLTGGN